ncbi:MAG: RdgB/HAM1 family non-canonical purine NTP pyrophosphatase [Alphaproteobacteria bacterium]|nr:RdgB/HAM1 family non-canonical purine NTP pyrophosphatase [Alphaproteobacteria bacterium]
MSGLLAKGSELVIASHNKGKVREIAELLAPFGFNVTSAAAYDLPEPEETGLTFAANAEIKALATSAATGKASLSDDSGLAVEGLDGAPGIYSARWAGESKDFGMAMERIRQELIAKGIPESDWRASFICALCLHVPGQEPQHFEGRIDGLLTFPPRGEKGFGYDPIFIPEGHTRTFAEMDSTEKHAMSHRARAFKLFVNALK